MSEQLDVPIFPGRSWAGLSDQAKKMYQKRYFQPNEDYELWLDRVCRANCDSREHRGRMKQYIRNYWFHPSTPVSTNSGLPQQGMPVSCFVQTIGDSKDGIFDAYEEAFYLGSRGAGIGASWDQVRHAGAKVGLNGESSGIVPFIKVSEGFTNAVSQGGARRASQAVYLNVHHPEIKEFIHLKDPTGDSKRRALSLFNGVSVTDEFMYAVADRTMYNLYHPKTGEVVEQLDAFEIWSELLTMRMTRGVPYILFLGNVNDQLPEAYSREGFCVTTSNLCTEITLHTRPDYSAICVLSSINVEFWDEFSQDSAAFNLFVEDCHRFLDNVLSNFLRDAKDERGFEKAVRSGEYERSIGLGIMGLHSLFQRKGLAFTDLAARSLNKMIVERLYNVLQQSNEKLADEKGAAPLAKKHGLRQRNVHVTTIAPTASISTLCNNTSQGIDPRIANVFLHKTNVGSYYVKNSYLQDLLVRYGKDSDDVWKSILNNGGSVAHLDFLSEHEKAIFQTAFEIPQEVLIQLAADRQPYIDQSQSLNLFIPPPVSVEYLDAIHMDAWAKGVKSLYYIRSDQPEKVSDLSDRRSADQVLQTNNEVKQRVYEECFWCG